MYKFELHDLLALTGCTYSTNYHNINTFIKLSQCNQPFTVINTHRSRKKKKKKEKETNTEEDDGRSFRIAADVRHRLSACTNLAFLGQFNRSFIYGFSRTVCAWDCNSTYLC